LFQAATRSIGIQYPDGNLWGSLSHILLIGQASQFPLFIDSVDKLARSNGFKGTIVTPGQNHGLQVAIGNAYLCYNNRCQSRVNKHPHKQIDPLLVPHIIQGGNACIPITMSMCFTWLDSIPKKSVVSVQKSGEPLPQLTLLTTPHPTFTSYSMPDVKGKPCQLTMCITIAPPHGELIETFFVVYVPPYVKGHEILAWKVYTHDNTVDVEGFYHSHYFFCKCNTVHANHGCSGLVPFHTK